MRRIGPALVLATLAAPPAAAQMVDIPIWSNGILGQQALRSTYDDYNRKNGITADRSSRPCSIDALPAADRKRMEIEYVRRLRTAGKASADGWVREQGQRFRTKLIAEGVCPAPPGGAAQTARADPPAPRSTRLKKPVLDKNGKPCTRTRVENRVTPGFGGEAMSMGLVVVCAN